MQNEGASVDLSQYDWLESFKSQAIYKFQESGQRLEDYLRPSTLGLYKLMVGDPTIRMLMEDMISQEQTDGSRVGAAKHIKGAQELLLVMNAVVRSAPNWNETGLVGCTLNMILVRYMATTAGYEFFRNKDVNRAIALVLMDWCQFLSSPESLYVINSQDGWLSEIAKTKLRMHEVYYDEEHEHGGFQSWNDFFTRSFKDGRRPLEGPDDDKIVVSACESTPYRISSNIGFEDRFWLKGQPYSLRDMLANDELAPEFVNGSIYQAFLSALNYHRWHSPINGTVVKTRSVPGTFYSQAESQGFDECGPDLSQAYITHVATRLLIFIKANDAVMGLVCVMMVGMGEISSCKLLDHIKPGYHLMKGEEMGYFQFGGSTHCMFFRNGVVKEFAPQAIPGQGKLVLLKTRVAVCN